MIQREPEEGQRPGQVPQDGCEGHHRHHGVDRTEEQCGGGPDGGGVGAGPRSRGEAVDIELDALVGVVDRVVEESAAVEGVPGKPVPGEPVGQPHPPADDETLGQIDVDHLARDIHRGEQHEGDDRRPEAADAGVADRGVTGPSALESDLERRVQIIALIAQQDGEPHRDQRGEQQHTQPHPHRHAGAAAEVAPAHSPELPAPGGETGQQYQDDDRRRRSDQPCFTRPQQGLRNLVRPVQRGLVHLHERPPPACRSGPAARGQHSSNPAPARVDWLRPARVRRPRRGSAARRPRRAVPDAGRDTGRRSVDG